jgi:hypothetical protein
MGQVAWVGLQDPRAGMEALLEPCLLVVVETPGKLFIFIVLTLTFLAVAVLVGPEQCESFGV